MAANSHQSHVATSPSANPEWTTTQVHSATVPVRRLGVGSTVNDDKAFRNAGFQCNRATILALSTPRSFGSAAPPAVDNIRPVQRFHAPARPPASSSVVHNVVIQFCVARC